MGIVVPCDICVVIRMNVFQTLDVSQASSEDYNPLEFDVQVIQNL